MHFDIKLTGKMLSVCSCEKYFSHGDKLLKDHLNYVGELCKEYAIRGAASKEICEAAEIIGKCHDFGKYNRFFQEYLCNQKKSGDLHTHAFISAIFASWLTYKKVKNPVLSTVAFLCVKSHHTSIKSFNVIEEDIRKLNNCPEYILKQAHSIKEKIGVITRELHEIGLEDAEYFINNFEECLKEVSNILNEANMSIKFGEDRSWEIYYETLFLYSCLVDSDKKDAGGAIKVQPPTQKLTPDIILKYKEHKGLSKNSANKIDEIKQAVFTEVDNTLQGILNEIDKHNIITITAPTGSGKTLTGLYAALKIKNSLKDGQHKIVYCLPYINIIEQIYSILKEALEIYYDSVPEPSLLLKHHHLAFPPNEYIRGEDDLHKLLLLVDSWESEIIVTTFEQLFGTLVGCKNTQLKKFHNLAGSIIILDEVQSLPLEYWRLIKEVMIKFTEKLQAKIIIMTATMPTIFKGTELIPKNRSYFESLERTLLIPKISEPVDHNSLVESFFSVWNKKDSALIVLNTIKTSKKVYRKIAEKLGEEAVTLTSNNMENIDTTKIILAYLSTSVLPSERMKRIEKIKDYLKDRYTVILISTQVVEAGVDLDFGVAIRDIGPLDSIVQVAGRCNRKGIMKNGSVYIFRVIDQDKKEDSGKIYGQILVDQSLKILKDRENISEKKLTELVDSYFNEISYRMNVETREESNDVFGEIRNLDFSSLSDFSLIKEEPKIPVYVEINDEAKKLLEEFNLHMGNIEKISSHDKSDLSELFNEKAILRRIRSEMENYTIEVYYNEESLRNLKAIMPHLKTHLIPNNEVEYYYDIETGYKHSYEKESENAIYI